MIRTFGPDELNPLEIKLQIAALQGNSTDFFQLLSDVKDSYGGQLSPEMVERLFVHFDGNVLFGILKNGPVDESIITAILDELLAHDFHYDFLIFNYCSAATLDSDGLSVISEEFSLSNNPLALANLAQRMNWGNISTHPLVQSAEQAAKIRALLVSGDINAARALFKESKEKFGFLEEDHFNESIIYHMPAEWDDETKDDVLSDLLAQYNINISVLEYNNIIPNPNLPKVQNTLAYQVWESAKRLENEPPPQENSLKALSLIRAYFSGLPERNRFIGDFYRSCSEAWLQDDPQAGFPRHGINMPVSRAADKRNILATLFKHITPTDDASPLLYNLHEILTLDEGSGMLFTNPKLVDGFASMSEAAQKEYIEKTFHCVPNPNPPFLGQPHFQALRLFCKNASPVYDLSSLSEMIVDPNNPAADRLDSRTMDRILRMMMESNLFKDLDQLAPGSHVLKWIDPETQEPYDLYKYIQKNDTLSQGYRAYLRNQELIEQYKLVKAFIKSEALTSEELHKLKEAYPESNLLDIKNFMQTFPDLGLAILAGVDPSLKDTQLPPPKRASTITRFYTIAKNQLEKENSVEPQVESKEKRRPPVG